MIIENEEYIKAFTPHTNGCKFSLIIKNNGDLYYTGGCDLRPNLTSGVNCYLWERFYLNNEKPVNLNISPELKIELMKIKPCENCGGTLFEQRTTADMRLVDARPN
jgi:hypothetical protein